jgi:hypothetical protein
MIRAYKKKKKELLKAKEKLFELEKEYVVLRQRNNLVEEELGST